MTLFTFPNEFMCDFLHIVALQKDLLNKALQSLVDVKVNFAETFDALFMLRLLDNAA